MVVEGLLVLADGTVFRGVSVGADGVASGEVVFTTSMTGYQEVVSDPSYAGQIVTMTAPHIGNYGVSGLDDQAGGPACAGFVVRSMARRSSSWRSEGLFSEYLRGHGVVALSEVDTRRLTRHIREHGAMPAAIGSGVGEAELVDVAASAPSMTGLDLATGVATSVVYERAAVGERLGRVVAIDLGIKRDIVASLAQRGLDVVVVPPSTDAETILSMGVDGVFVSNGPGDPEPLVGPIATLQGLLGRVPVFGICLGHQVLGSALGAATFKLPFGHHGGNHPVRRMADGVVEITSQNHGFAVDLWSLRGESAPVRSGLPDAGLLPDVVDTAFGAVEPTHQNLNDGTLEGLRCLDVAAFSVQYHPEAAPGPADADHLFDGFVELMGLGGR